MEQVGDFLEAGVVSQIVDIVAPIRETRALLAYRAYFGVAGDDAGESAGFFLAHIGSVAGERQL